MPISSFWQPADGKIFWWREMRRLQLHHLGYPFICFLISGRFVFLFFPYRMITIIKHFQILLLVRCCCTSVEGSGSFVINDFVLVTDEKQMRVFHGFQIILHIHQALVHAHDDGAGHDGWHRSIDVHHYLGVISVVGHPLKLQSWVDGQQFSSGHVAYFGDGLCSHSPLSMFGEGEERCGINYASEVDIWIFEQESLRD